MNKIVWRSFVLSSNQDFVGSTSRCCTGSHIHMHPDSLPQLNCLWLFPEGRAGASKCGVNTTMSLSVIVRLSGSLPLPAPVSFQNKPRWIGSDADFIISSGTIRWAGARLAWTRLSRCHPERWMGGDAPPQLLPLRAVQEPRRLKIPDKNKKQSRQKRRRENMILRQQETEEGVFLFVCLDLARWHRTPQPCGCSKFL